MIMSLNIVELKRMREIFADTPEENIDMGTFGRKTPCGTAYCLAGAYLILGKAEDHLGRIGKWSPTVGDRKRFLVTFNNERLMGLLGISMYQYDYLFIDSASLTKEEVLERLDQFIASGGEIPE
jgi:hypothetical protein